MSDSYEVTQFDLWWVSNPSNMLNLTPEMAERVRLTAKSAWEASRHAERLTPLVKAWRINPDNENHRALWKAAEHLLEEERSSDGRAN